MQENNINPKVTELLEKIQKKNAKPTMSVMEMGKTLGLQKTDSYRLVNKRFFKTMQVNGKTRVDMESFNRWYDSQVKYQIVGGRPPGSLIRELSFSPKEMADELGISEAYVYEVIDQYNIPVTTFDYLKRVMKKDFYAWYQSQSHFRTKADREKDAALERDSITMPEMGRILGIPRSEVYRILSLKKNRGIFEIVVAGDKKRITKESFEKWYATQAEYKKVPERFLIDAAERESRWRKNYRRADPDYYTIGEAAEKFGIPRATIYRWVKKDKVYSERIDTMLLLPRKSFDLWVKKNVRGKGHVLWQQ